MSISSPCIKLCRLDPRSGLCEGCLRTSQEIAHWFTATDEEKQAILAAVALRSAQRGQPAGGSAT